MHRYTHIEGSGEAAFPVRLRVNAAAAEEGEPRQVIDLETTRGFVTCALIERPEGVVFEGVDEREIDPDCAAAVSGGSSSFLNACLLAEGVVSWLMEDSPEALAEAFEALYSKDIRFRGVIAAMFMGHVTTQFQKLGEEGPGE